VHLHGRHSIDAHGRCVVLAGAAPLVAVMAEMVHMLGACGVELLPAATLRLRALNPHRTQAYAAWRRAGIAVSVTSTCAYTCSMGSTGWTLRTTRKEGVTE
jgi:hypothetical protein